MYNSIVSIQLLTSKNLVSKRLTLLFPSSNFILRRPFIRHLAFHKAFYEAFKGGEVNHCEKYKKVNHHEKYLIINCPAQKIIENQTFNHKMFTGCIIYTCTMLNAAITVSSQIVTWNNLQGKVLSERERQNS